MNTLIKTVIASPISPIAPSTAWHFTLALALLSVLACGIAAWSGHLLAAVKFGFAAIAGLVIGRFVSYSLGSYVISCLDCFALGLIVAWYVIRGKSTPDKLEKLLQEAKNKIV